MKFEVTKELIEEMAQCIEDCQGKWADGEIFAYMFSCITDSDSYEPDDFKIGGRLSGKGIN